MESAPSASVNAAAGGWGTPRGLIGVKGGAANRPRVVARTPNKADFVRDCFQNADRSSAAGVAPSFLPLDAKDVCVKKICTTVALLALGSLATPVLAADCAVTIEGNDQMQFNIKSVEVPKSCTSFTMTLKHTGKMSKSTMGHNIVVATTADTNAAAADGLKAGAANEYVKPGDARVLAFTKMIGGGETTSVNLDVAKLKAGTEYTYFCSFPGHSFIMRGVLKLGS